MIDAWPRAGLLLVSGGLIKLIRLRYRLCAWLLRDVLSAWHWLRLHSRVLNDHRLSLVAELLGRNGGVLAATR